MMQVMFLVLGVMAVVIVYLIAAVLQQEDQIRELEQKMNSAVRRIAELERR